MKIKITMGRLVFKAAVAFAFAREAAKGAVEAVKAEIIDAFPFLAVKTDSPGLPAFIWGHKLAFYADGKPIYYVRNIFGKWFMTASPFNMCCYKIPVINPPNDPAFKKT